jgi:HEAT repeat protein/beta-lactamase regulating signal transducer with metallopeptidase domain
MTFLTLWVLTYLLQSTLLLGGAWLASRWLHRHALISETVWRVAVVGSIVGPLLVSAGFVRPLGVRVAINTFEPRSAATAEIAMPAPILPDPREIELRDRPAAEPSTGEPAHGSGEPVRTEPGAAVSTEILPASWLGAAALIVLWHFARRWRLFALLADREPVTDAAVVRAFADLSVASGVKRAIRLTSSPACPVPMALTASEVCVPARFLLELDDDQQRGALAHEVAHVARRDPQWLTVDAVIGAIFFFQPLNVIARRALRASAELQCDDWAARQGAGPGLARCLAEVATWLQPFPRNLLAVTIPMATRSDLVPRVERLLTETVSVMPTTRLRPFLAATIVVAVVAAAAPAFSAATPEPSPDSAVTMTEPPISTMAIGAAIADAAESSAPVAPRHASQAPAVRSSRQGTTLAERWSSALTDARRLSQRGFWIGYSFAFPLTPNSQHISDSDGLEINDFNWDGPRLGEQLGTGIDDGIAVLVHYRNGRDGTVDRITHRSLNAPMEFDGAVVYWLGAVDDRQSVPWLDAMQQRLRPSELRQELVEAITMHRTTGIVLPVIDRLLSSEPDAALRAEAAEGLEWHDAPAALQLARQTARGDRDSTVRSEAAEAIGEIQVAGAVDVLVELTRLDDPAVRGEAAEALGSQPAADALRGIETVVFEVPHEDARNEAVEALGEIESALALPLLRRIIADHPHAGTRVEAVETLGDLENFDPLSDLKYLLEQSTDPDVRNEALEVLAGLDSPAAYALLLHIAAESASSETRKEALDELGGASSKSRTAAELDQTAAFLERVIFADPDESVQREAIDALEHLPRSRALTILRKVVETHPSSRMRREAIEGIEDLARKHDQG